MQQMLFENETELDSIFEFSLEYIKIRNIIFTNKVDKNESSIKIIQVLFVLYMFIHIQISHFAL